jgi:potassium-transporting ATPase KdpC subunit
MNPIRELSKALRFTVVIWLLVAVIYPFLMLGIGQGLLSDRANGSLIRNSSGVVLGSSLIGQPFISDRYFNSRPSTTNYSTADPKDDKANILKTGVSGASNLAPSNPALLDRIKGKPDPDPSKAIAGEISRLKGSGITPTADLVYTSGSSLDPHITPAAAKAQIPRIAQARKITPERLESLIQQNTDGRFLGIFGEEGVNVLKLNLALDPSESL